MAAVAHGWEPSGRKSIPPNVGKEFHEADKKAGRFEHPGRIEKLKR